MSFWDDLLNFLKRLFGSSPTPPAPPEPAGQKPAPVERKVFVIVFNPTVPSEGGRRLTEVMGWNNPDDLIAGFIDDIHACSDGYASIVVTQKVEVDRFPVKEDGFAYTGDQFVQNWRAGAGFHQPDTADYSRILTDFNVVDGINRGAYDEVWMVGFPYAGFYESRMVGPGAFWCNGPELPAPQPCNRRFVVMGFNYERGVGEMLESLGHRAESIMLYTFRSVPAPSNLWQRYIRYNLTHPGMAEIGTVHFAPNSLKDYDWGNPTPVVSRCDTWNHFPDLVGQPRRVDCSEWGNGDIREHHRWWLRHLPHFTGAADGIAYNWWKYVIDPNEVH